MEQILVTRGNGTAVHIGITYQNGALATRCNGWPTDVRSSSVRINKTALRPTCKKCIASMPTVEETVEVDLVAAHAESMDRIDEKLAMADAALESLGISMDRIDEKLAMADAALESLGIDPEVEEVDPAGFGRTRCPSCRAVWTDGGVECRDCRKASATEDEERRLAIRIQSFRVVEAKHRWLEEREELVRLVEEAAPHLSEYTLAAEADVTRQTIRQWLGKG